MKKSNSYKHIFKYTSLFGSVQGLNILVGLIRNKLVAVLLGPSGVGLISVYNTASTFIQNATNFGLQMSGVREISQANDSCNENETNHYIAILRSWVLLAALFGFMVCLALCSTLSYWFFESYEHTLHFALLAPVVAMATITGGETAILKATRRLKPLAKISVIGVFAALFISIPLFIKWGEDGIIPSLLLVGCFQMFITVCYSYYYYRPTVSLKLLRLSEGKAMLVVGGAFVVAGIMGNGADMIIKAFLSNQSLSLAGLYNSGYMITMTYAGMIFAAMETDYYPHLSAVCNNVQKMNGAVNRQIEVSIIMVAPMLVALLIGLQILIPLLFSGKFIPVIAMTQVTVIAMYFRAVNLPVSYIMLAKGDSKSYLLMESVYDILIVLTVIFGYNNWGLTGTGIALAVTSFVDCVCVVVYCIWKYDFGLSDKLMKNIAIQLFVGLLALAVVMVTEGWLYWILGSVLFATSALISIKMYKGID